MTASISRIKYSALAHVSILVDVKVYQNGRQVAVYHPEHVETAGKGDGRKSKGRRGNTHTHTHVLSFQFTERMNPE